MPYLSTMAFPCPLICESTPRRLESLYPELSIACLCSGSVKDALFTATSIATCVVLRGGATGFRVASLYSCYTEMTAAMHVYTKYYMNTYTIIHTSINSNNVVAV